MKKFALFGMLALLSACDGNRSGAEAAVRHALKDPESARFGAFYYNEDTKRGCLAVNAKNSMGGYTGEQQANVEKRDSGWEVHDIDDMDPDSCRRVYADQKAD